MDNVNNIIYGATEQQLYHPNLVRNGIFTKLSDIVNMRGLMSYPVGGFKDYNCISSWFTNSAKLDIISGSNEGINHDFIRISSIGTLIWSFFAQLIDTPKLIIGRTYTLSVLARCKNTNKYKPAAYLSSGSDGLQPMSGNANISIDVSEDFRLYTRQFIVTNEYQNLFGVRFNLGDNTPENNVVLDIAAVKVEEGSVSTLMNNLSQNIDAEVNRCLIYEVPLKQYARFNMVTYYDSPNQIDFIIPLTNPLRVFPNFPQDLFGVQTTSFQYTDFVFSAYITISRTSGPGFGVRATKNNHGVTTAYLQVRKDGFLDSNL